MLLDIDDPRYVAYCRRVFGDDPDTPFERVNRQFNRAYAWWESLTPEQQEHESENVFRDGIPEVVRIDQVMAAFPHCQDQWQRFIDVFPRGEARVTKKNVKRAVEHGLDVWSLLEFFGLDDLMKALLPFMREQSCALVQTYWKAIRLWRQANGRS